MVKNMETYNVLLIEDNRGDALLIQEMLRLSQSWSFQIVTAITLKGAIEELKNHNFDFIIADLGLPDSQGLNTIVSISEYIRNIPAIVLTSNNDEQLGGELLKAGAQDYLVKWAINSDQLMRSIRHAFHRKKVEEKLIESEEKFRVVLENIHLIGLMLDNEGRVTFVNNYLVNLIGWSKKEMLGKNWFETYLPPDSRNKERANFEHLLENSHAPSANENEIICKDGRVLVISWSNTVHCDKNGNPDVITSIGENITERIKTKSELAKNEKRYHSIIEDQTQAIVRYLPGGEITFVNDSYCKIQQKKASELIGQDFYAQFDPKHAQGIISKASSLTIKNPVCIDEQKISLSDGRTLWQQWTDRAIFDENGTLAEYQAEGIDITSTKLAEEALKKSEEKFRTMVEASPDGVTTSSLSGEITYASKRAVELFGVALPSQLIGKGYLTLVAPENKKKAENVFGKILEKGTIMNVSLILLQNDGSRFYGQISVTVITSETGLPEGLIIFTKDISDNKNAENAIKAYQQNLRSMASELNLAEEKERRRIACDLHDDLGQSLAMARIKISSIKNENVSEKVMEELVEMEKHVTHAIKNSRSLTYELSPPVLYEFGLTAGINWKLEQITSKHNLTANMEITEEIPALSEDLLILLFRSVSELLNNIVKHAQAKTVSVVVSMDGHCLNIIVSDDGKGFNILDIEKRTDYASGIGLFSLKERLEYFEGTLNIDSAVGKGSKIYVSVPLNL